MLDSCLRKHRSMVSDSGPVKLCCTAPEEKSVRNRSQRGMRLDVPRPSSFSTDAEGCDRGSGYLG